MAEFQSYIFDFQRVPRFFKDWNVNFKVDDMQKTDNLFQIVFCDIAPDNLVDCLNGTVLNGNVNIVGTCDISLNYDNDVISVRNDATWTIGENIKQIKAIFVRVKSTGYVMGYSINTTAFDVTNEVVIEKDTILWSIVNG